MPSKLRKVVGSVKDQTSISLALVAFRSSSTNLEVAILKATSHDEIPVNERYSTEVLLLAASSPSAAVTAATLLHRRLSRTSNWVVALKTLTVIYTTIIDAGPDFRHEAANQRLLHLSSFRSSPWDFTAFVRTYAFYLDARLQSSLEGYISLRRRQRRHPTDLKPPMLLDRIEHWQLLIDRAMGTRPTGPAKKNRLVQITLCTIVRESFDLYHDIAGGISLLLDGFFQLPYKTAILTYEACDKATRQFEELNEFYEQCKNTGVGRSSEYPNVQRISKELLDRLDEYLKNHKDSGSSVRARIRSGSSQKLLLGQPRESRLEMFVVRRRSTSFFEGQKMVEFESSSPTSTIMSHNRTNLFTDAKLTRSSSANAREEEMKQKENRSFENSAWIQKRLDEPTRKKLIQEQQQWVQYQNKIMERNLAFL